MTKNYVIWLIAAMFIASGGKARADSAIDNAIVYIECMASSGQISRGTGVVVSDNGMVLTAKHVVPDGATCRGSLGRADSNAATLLVSQPVVSPVDAALLRFSANGVYKFATYCILEDWMVRKFIFVAGYPGGTQTGTVSFRRGVLSTLFRNPKGVIETDGLTAAGMSGGPVFSNNLESIIGIVIGADFAPDGNPRYYGILPLSQIALNFGLRQSKNPCYRKNKYMEISPEALAWTANKEPLKLGMKINDGVCYLSRVWGQFNDSHDAVGIEVIDGEFALVGVNKAGGEHGAKPLCIWND